MKTKIHINQHHIRANLKDGGDRAVVTAKTYKDNRYGHTVEIDGPSRVVYPARPLSCGARVWIETESPVRVFLRDGTEVI